MWRRQSSQTGWREVIAPVQQEVSQYGSASLEALQTVLHALASIGAFPNTPGALDGVVLLAQQLSAYSANSSSCPAAQAPSAAPQQQQQTQLLVPVCITFCGILKSALASHSDQQQQRTHRWQQQQQQQQPEQLLPSAAATALCSCLRCWADPSSSSRKGSAAAAAVGSAQWQWSQLQAAAVDTLAVLLPKQLPAVADHERAAVLALLLSLLQANKSTNFSNNSSSGTDTVSSTQNVSSNIIESSLNPNLSLASTVAQLLGQLCKRCSALGLHADEASNITRALVDALTSSSSSSSNNSSGPGSSSNGHSNQRLSEDSAHVKHYTTLLTALYHAVYADKQGWQSHAGQLTEAARKLLTYGTHQQQMQQKKANPGQQQGRQAAGLQQQQQSPKQDVGSQQQQQQQAVVISSPSSSGNTTTSSTTTVGAAAPRQAGVRYVPPHMRSSSSAAAAPAPAPVLQVQAGSTAAAASPQQQQQDVSSDLDSATDWSDISDSEQQPTYRHSSSSSRHPSLHISSKRSGRDSELEQQQQQALTALDPIKSYRVRVALLQLLQALVYIDPRALHPYLSVLLPHQQPLQRRPLSPHLITVLMYDPCNKVRQLSAGIISALLEGPAARALLAVAEARGTKAPVRGFTTLSMSLGQMLLSLHTGLLAAVKTWQQQRQSPQQQQQQQDVLDRMSNPLLTAVLRALCNLVQMTPYDRFHCTNLLPDIVEAIWSLWQQQQQDTAAAAGEDGSSSSNSVTAAVAVLAQALSTKKADAGLQNWLLQQTPAAAAAAAGISDKGPSSSSHGSSLAQQLLVAAVSPNPLLRIEALAALRGCCINYPAVAAAAADPYASDETNKGVTVSSSDSCSSSSAWRDIVGALHCNIQETNQVLRTPRGIARGPPAASSSSTEVSASTSAEDKAAQHAVKLIGDCLTAAWLNIGSSIGADSSSTSGSGNAGAEHLQESNAIAAAAAAAAAGLAGMWGEATDLLLSHQIWQHPNYMIRSAAAAVLAEIPAVVWQQLLPDQQQQVLTSLAAAAANDGVTAARAAACKVLGTLVLLPGLVQDQQRLLLLLRQPLGSSIRDSAVSVRLNASWAVANACDALKQPMHAVAHVRSTAAAAVNNSIGASQICSDHAIPIAAEVSVTPVVLQLLCESASTAAADSEKVRANGIRAVGALLSAWQQHWGLSSSSSGVTMHTERHSSSSSNLSDPTHTECSSSRSSSDWSWVSGWLKSAIALLQSCLAARSMKVVWNAAYAAAGLLANTHLHAAAEVSTCIPGLLLLLIVLVRDSSNYKIKIHAAAALGAVSDRVTFGAVFADAVLVLAAALESLESGSSSSSENGLAAGKAAAAAVGVGNGGDAGACEDDGSFPNFRYVPALQAQLQQSLLHLLAMLQPDDAPRLREPLQRRKALLLQIIQQQQLQMTAAAPAEHYGGVVDDPQAAGSSSSSSGGRKHGQQRADQGPAGASVQPQQQQQRRRLPSDPFGQGQSESLVQHKENHQQQQQVWQQEAPGAHVGRDQTKGISGGVNSASKPGLVRDSGGGTFGVSFGVIANGVAVQGKVEDVEETSSHACKAWTGLLRLLGELE